MGLIKAGIGALGSTLADQWKEFFYCDALDHEYLAVKGKKKVSGRSSNTKGSDNVISSGSGIAVADGQCMMIVEQGKVVEICAEPGEYTFDRSTESSIFSGNLGESILESFKTLGKRFTYGGDTGKDQRVYYFNTKEIVDNKFGTPTPIPFRVVDRNIGLDIDVSVRCNGLYSYRITDPLLFYTNVCGNFDQAYRRSELDAQLKSEFISALQPAFAAISQQQVRPSALPAHAVQLSEEMNLQLTEKWKKLRGISIVSIAMNPITLPEDEAELIRKAQHAAIMRDPAMAAATLTEAQAAAMKAAAANENGAMMGFMGLGMANQAGGASLADLYQMSQKNGAAQKQESTPAKGGWTCRCGAVNTSRFCPQCGEAKPEDGSWICSCGATNSSKFCSECGKKKPGGEFVCDKCGWKPEKGEKAPKFCPECGDVFDHKDMK